MADSSGKTEKPTPRRLKKARKEGQFPRTQDAATWMAIAAGAALLPQSGQILHERFLKLIDRLPEVAQDPTPGRALQVVAALPVAVLLSAAPVCLAAAFAALLATAVQGVHLTGKTLTPKFNRLSPKQGLKRMFGPRAAWEAAKAVAKVSVIAVVVTVVGRDLVPELAGAGSLSLSALLARTRDGLETTIWAAAVAGLLIALADYAYQRRTTMKQLKMSPREVKDEVKQTEGDPMIKQAIRSRQIAVSQNRMLAAVGNADVVLVNPTHVAVALRYQPGRGAPRVVAKGAGAVAAKIRERAREHRVPLVEDRPLARTLYRVCELDEEVPAELYMAVARILAFVMAAGKPSRTASTPTRPRSTVPVPELPSRAALRARRSREVRAARGDPSRRG